MKPSCYTRPDKPLRLPVTPRRGREVVPAAFKAAAPPVAVDRASECHVTPPDVAARMVEYLGDYAGPILEPSAGTGNLVAALIAAGADPGDIVAVERHLTLAAGLQSRFPGVAVYPEDFLEHAAADCGRFGAVIINPPFSAARAHIAAAISVLAPGGVMVALVPVTFRHDYAEEIETLTPDTFAAARVHTKLIRLEKPEAP